MDSGSEIYPVRGRPILQVSVINDTTKALVCKLITLPNVYSVETEVLRAICWEASRIQPRGPVPSSAPPPTALPAILSLSRFPGHQFSYLAFPVMQDRPMLKEGA